MRLYILFSGLLKDFKVRANFLSLYIIFSIYANSFLIFFQKYRHFEKAFFEGIRGENFSKNDGKSFRKMNL